MKNAAVTLVTPVFNGARFLSETIESVLAQRGIAIDYHVVDDGSTDASPEVIARFHGRLTANRHPRSGQAAAMNRVWAAARTPYLAYLSADDLLAPDTLARMAAVLEADAGAVSVYPAFRLIDARGRTIRANAGAPFSLEKLVVGGVNPIGPGALFRRAAFDALGGWREDITIGADRDFWMRMSGLGEVRFVPDNLAAYRVHRRALSRGAAGARRAEGIIAAVSDYLDRPGTPAHLRDRAPEAMANAHREVASRLARSGAVAAAMRHWAEARRQASLAGDRGSHEYGAGIGAKLRVARALLQ